MNEAPTLPLTTEQVVALSRVNLPSDTVTADASVVAVDGCLLVQVLTETRSFNVRIDREGETDETECAA